MRKSRINHFLSISMRWLFCILIACSKKDPSSPNTPLSSEKKLNGVEFKATDNPGLTEDITGLIIGNSLTAKFPSNISLNGLIPTINFSGGAISPANKTPQNFSAPLTYKITAQDGSFIDYIFTCTYRTFSDTTTMIKVRWGVIKDSVTNNNFTYPNGLYPNPGVYFGVPADYCDFRTDGRVYIFENNNSDNSPYQILPDGRISITTFGNYNYECSILYLSSSKMTLFWNLISASGGQYTRTLYLSR